MFEVRPRMFFQKPKRKTKSWQRKSPKIYSAAPRKIKRDRKFTIARFFYWILLLSFIGVCGYLFLFSPLLDVEVISIEGNESVPAEEITAVVNSVISGKYLDCFSKRNFLLLNKRKIKEALKSNFSRVSRVEVEKKFPKTILISVVERGAELIWCSGGVCYLVDDSGLVYSGASGTDEELRDENFLTVIDDSARPVDIGGTTFDQEFIKYLKEMNAALKDEIKLVEKENYHTPSLASREITVKTKEGWFLKLSSLIPFKEIKTIILTVFEKDPILADAEKRKRLDYLDLRIKNKVYYKLK